MKIIYNKEDDQYLVCKPSCNELYYCMIFSSCRNMDSQKLRIWFLQQIIFADNDFMVSYYHGGKFHIVTSLLNCQPFLYHHPMTMTKPKLCILK